MTGGGVRDACALVIRTATTRQRMRGRSVLVLTRQGSNVVYTHVWGQAPELVYPALEPMLAQALQSFQWAGPGQ